MHPVSLIAISFGQESHAQSWWKETTPKSSLRIVVIFCGVERGSSCWEDDETGDAPGVGSTETERSSVWTEDWVISAPQPWAREISDF